MVNLNDAYEIARYIKEVTKKTPVKAYVNTTSEVEFSASEDYTVFGSGNSVIIIGDYDAVQAELDRLGDAVKDVHMEYDRRNSAIPLKNTLHESARIEPGSIIRDMVTIEKNAVVMMGAVINIGAVVGEGSMVDMNAVIGARGTLGKNVHLGAGAVVAGVLEPPSADPVIVEDNVMIGANAVILEGVRIGEGAVVAAGAVVTQNVPAGAVVAGSPAKVIKMKDEKTAEKTKLMDDLRQLD